MDSRLTATLRVLGWMGFYLLLSAPAFFPAGASSSNSFVIRKARLFDGHKVLPNTDVWVEAGKIKAVGKDLKVSSEVRTIDAAGDTLLPGLIDSHTHTWGDALKEAEIFGVTTELDMFTDVNGAPSSKFGTGWMVSTDSIAGGKSTGDMKVVDGGVDGGKHALEITGMIDGGLPYAWSGVMFSPGAQVFAPVNLSSKKNITFYAKGDGGTYRVMFFTESGGRMPSQQTFAAGPDWKKTSIPFSAFNGTDGHDISAILFVGGPQAGKFDFQIDEIRLE